MAELRIDTNDNGVGPAIEEAEEDDEDVGDLEGLTEGSDEEYVPATEPAPSAPSTSAARKRKAQARTEKTENGEAVEEDSRKDAVQCPVCDKSFKSKYYLKVHNRYTSPASFSTVIAVERAATNASLSQAAYGGEAFRLP